MRIWSSFVLLLLLFNGSLLAQESPWLNQDVGEVGQAGSASFASADSSIEVIGSGADIWNPADGFHFVYQRLSGDGEIVARVTDLEASEGWAKAGVMIRDSLAADAAHVMAHLTEGNGALMTWRRSAGSESGSSSDNRSAASAEADAPLWFKLVRAGDTVSGYLSTDGESWEAMGSRTISMDDEVFVGLAVTSHDNSRLARAEFAQVQVTTSLDELAQESQSELEPMPAPDAADYYVATDGSDSNSGRSAAEAFRTIQQAAEVVEPGDTVYIREGVYPRPVEVTVSGTEANPITFMSYPGEWAILDGSERSPGKGDAQLWVKNLSWNIFKNLEIRRSPGEGILVQNSDHNVFDNIATHDNYYSGITLTSSSRNRLLNIESYGTFDEHNPNGRPGDNADGISITSGDSNYIYNCHTYNNSDDGVDTWESTGTVIDGCLSHHNGRGSHGNGNGFKLGPGQDYKSSTLIRRSVAYGNRRSGFTTNNGGDIVMLNNTSFNNGTENFDVHLGQESTRGRRNRLVNNLSFRGENFFDESASGSHNSWNLNISRPRFVSTDPDAPGFLRLNPNSPAIDAGKEVGLLYYGEAPDLGAFEYEQGAATLPH